MTTFNPTVALIPAHQLGAIAVMPATSLFTLLEDTVEHGPLVEALGHGETYFAGGKDHPEAYVVSLSHRDTPFHLPNRTIACAAYSAFCFLKGLDENVDAQENLTNYLARNHPLADYAVIHWLSAFVDAFDELEA